VVSEGSMEASMTPRRIRGEVMRTLRLFVAIAFVALAGLVSTPAALAQNAGNAGKAKVKVYDFSGDTIEGDLIKPEGTTVDAIDFAKHSSLIRIRKNFIAEILKSAEDL
jgi:hypothetical protein